MQEFRLNRLEWGLGGYELLYRSKDDYAIMVAKPVEFAELKLNTAVEPMMKVSEEAVQTLINQLWIAGIRPSRKLVEPFNVEHLDGEIKWLRETADHLMKKVK